MGSQLERSVLTRRAALMGLKLTLGFISRVVAGKRVLRSACAGPQTCADDEPNSHSKISIVTIPVTPHEHLDLDPGLTSLDDANLFRRGRRQVDNGPFLPILTIRPAIYDHNVD